MSSLNRVTLIGRLGKDPELRYTRNQTPFARFSLATSETFTVDGERREKTEWHNLVVWGKQAEIAGRYLKKGKQIYAEGRIEYRDFEGQDGQKRFFTDIKVDRFVMLGSPGDGGGSGGYGGQGGYGGGRQDDYEPQAYGAPRGGGGSKAGEPRPTTYGAPMSDADVPESDDFNDDDIPF